MKNYDINMIAEELMFTIEEYKEIAEIYFEEMDSLLAECQSAIQSEDYIAAGKIMHGIKGASANLRMDDIAGLAGEGEKIVKQGGGVEVVPYLPKLQEEIALIKECVEQFFLGQ